MRELYSDVEFEMDSEEEVEPEEGGESEMDGEGSTVAGETRARHAGQRLSEAGPWSHFVSSSVSQRRSM
jgi:hypothetical protein